MLASSRKLLARNESGQRQLDLAKTGREAAEELYDQLVSFDKFVQSVGWANLKPHKMQLPQQPPKPGVCGDIARLKERNE